MDVSFEAYCREDNNEQTYENWLKTKVREAEQRHGNQQEIDKLRGEIQRLQMCLAAHENVIRWFDNWLHEWSKKASRSSSDVYIRWCQAKSQVEKDNEKAD
jgi:hypothetical protein